MGPFIKGIKRDKISLCYYPLKYIRKLLFIIFAALVTNVII